MKIKAIHININDYNKSDYIAFPISWLKLEDYDLKILILVSILGDVNLTFQGQLMNIREWLDLKSNDTNNKRIKKAIDNLLSGNYINCTKNGKIYNITLVDRAKEENAIIEIKKSWVETFKNYKEQVENVSVSWVKVIKVFVCIINSLNNGVHLLTQKEIAKELNVKSIETVSSAQKVITQCKLEGISVYKHIIKQKLLYEIRNIGTEFSILIEF